MFVDQKVAGFSGNFRQFKKQLKKARPTIVSALTAKMPEVNTHLQEVYPDNVSQEHGVLCMSARRDSIIMWGHYCDSHRGMVIGFDAGWEIFQQPIKGLRKVNYVREHVLWNTSCQAAQKRERIPNN
jgi:hypothetical protein